MKCPKYRHGKSICCLGRREGEVTATKSRILGKGNKNILKLIVMMAEQIFDYIKAHWFRHFKCLNCMM
jgi:hypothetical protein